MVERDKTLDFLRVISMCLVVFIHVANCYFRNYASLSSTSYLFADVFNILARVSVPIFFMISGALLIGKEVKRDKYISRIKRMVIVLIAWTFIYFMWKIFFLKAPAPNIFYLLFTPDRAHLWFIYAIIAIYIVLPFVNKLAKNLTKKEENYFIILWLIFCGIYNTAGNIAHTSYYVLPIVSGAYYLGYFMAGNIFYKRIKESNKEELKKYNRPLILVYALSNIILLIISVILTSVNDAANKTFLTYSNIFMMLSSLTIFLLVLINYTGNFDKKNIIGKIAPCSFGIYLIHAIFLDILNRFIDLPDIHSIIGVPLLSIVLIIISYFVIKYLRLIPFVKKYLT